MVGVGVCKGEGVEIWRKYREKTASSKNGKRSKILVEGKRSHSTKPKEFLSSTFPPPTLFQTSLVILERRYRRLAFSCRRPPGGETHPGGVISDLQRFVYAAWSKAEVSSKDTNVGRCVSSVKNF